MHAMVLMMAFVVTMIMLLVLDAGCCDDLFLPRPFVVSSSSLSVDGNFMRTLGSALRAAGVGGGSAISCGGGGGVRWVCVWLWVVMVTVSIC